MGSVTPDIRRECLHPAEDGSGRVCRRVCAPGRDYHGGGHWYANPDLDGGFVRHATAHWIVTGQQPDAGPHGEEAMSLLAGTYDEWRVCGRSAAAGTWHGPWRRTELNANEAKCLKPRNQEVWIERRTLTVTISNERREEVE